MNTLLIAIKSGLTALRDPTRQDMVAALGEVTGHSALISMRNRMLLDRTGRKILKQRPIINSSTLSFEKLSSFPEQTFGRAYLLFMQSNAISPDTRSPVKHIMDEELAYVMLRYRQTHDFYHVLTGLGHITIESEIALKWFEFMQTGLPMTLLSGVLGPMKLSLEKRRHMKDVYLPWAIKSGSNSEFLLNVMYEDVLEMPLLELQRKLNITPFGICT